MTRLLKRITHGENDLSSLRRPTKQQIFNTICRHNLGKAMELFQNHVSPREFNTYAKEKDDEDVTPLMMAAMASSDKVLMTLITNIFLTNTCRREEKGKHLHDKDKHGRTLMKIVIAQGDSLAFAKEMLMKIERDFHREDKDPEIVPLVHCFQNKLGPSRQVATALKDEQMYLTPTKGKFKVWFCVFCQFMIPFSIYLQDVVTDSLLAKEYHHGIKSNGTNFSTCQVINTAFTSPS